MRIFKLFFEILIDFFASMFPIQQNKDEKKFLILNYWHLGDYIMLLEAYKEIRKYFPKHKIFFLSNLEIAKENKNFDEIIDIKLSSFFSEFGMNIRNIIYRFNMFRKINIKYDYIFNLERHGNDLTTLMINLKSNNKIGYEQEYIGLKKQIWKIFSKVYTQKVNSKILHNTLSMKYLFSQTIPEYKIQEDNYYLPKLDSANIEQYNSLTDKKYYVICLGSADKFRNWEIEKFIAFSEKSVTKAENIVLVGSKEEKFSGETFVSKYKGNKNIINLIGKTNLKELVSVMKYAKFYMGNDTGTTHLAISLKIPSIAIVCGANFNCCLPYFEDNKQNLQYFNNISVYKKMDCFLCWYKCKYLNSISKNYKCLEEITEQDVLDQFNILKGHCSIE
jgi:heptosyltransferase-2